MTGRTWLVVLSLSIFLPTRGAAAEAPETVPVRVYDTARLASGRSGEALDVATSTLAPAARVEWRWCTGPDVHRTCDAPPAPGELVLRIVRAPRGPVGRMGAAAALRSGAPMPLGDAFVHAPSGSGALATVYADRVAQLATAGVPLGRLLGYAIAHEIAHLLLATTDHAAHGLMRPIWSRRQVRFWRPEDWILTPRDTAAIRARLGATRTAAAFVEGEP